MLAAAAALAVGVVATGCGGSSSTTTTTSATATWAGDVCSSFATWRKSVDQAKATLADPASISKNTLTAAADTITAANKQLAADLSHLQGPQTTSGEQAVKTLDTLRVQLQSGWQTVQDGLASGDTGVLATVSSVTGTLATMGTQLRTAIDDIKGLDPKGELDTAFQQAPACQQFVEKR